MNIQQIKSGKAKGRLNLILSVCMATALIVGASAFNLFQNSTAQAYVSANLASPYQDEEEASGKMSMASIPAGTTGEVAVPVMLTEAVDVGTISAKIYYDDSKLKALSCTNKDTGGQCNVEIEGGEARFNVTYVDGLDGTSKMTEIVFEVLEPSETDLSFELDIATSASSDGVAFELEVLEGTALPLTLENDERRLFLPLIQK